LPNISAAVGPLLLVESVGLLQATIEPSNVHISRHFKNLITAQDIL
jgi:flagellar basal body rod protein FlgG